MYKKSIYFKFYLFICELKNLNIKNDFEIDTIIKLFDVAQVNSKLN